jgi:chromosome partitioning protein
MALADQAVPAWVRDVRTVSADCVVIDTAPSDRALGASIALANVVLVPCTPSSLDLDATMRTLEIIDAVRIRRGGCPKMILVPNRVDVRTLEGRQLLDELTAFSETVSPIIGDRAPFVRAAATGRYVGEESGGAAAHREIEQLCDVVEKSLATACGREVRT